MEGIESGLAGISSELDSDLLSSSISGFLTTIKYENIPEDCCKLATNAFVDTVGVMMLGVREDLVSILRMQFLRTTPDEARACLSSQRVWGPDAALIGGAAAHALDFDDHSLTGHPSSVLVPAILAEADCLNSSGREMLTAYVAGYEVWAELIRRSTNYHRKGWHPTSVFGTVAAAAASCVLRKLTLQQTVTSLAVAASQSCGLAVNFGTMTKPFHAGCAAKNGLLSTRLASAGMSAAPDPFENEQGFLMAFAPDSRPDLESPTQLGKEWYLARHKLCIKKYPTCYFTHRSFDAVQTLLDGRKVCPDDIVCVEVIMGIGQSAVLVNKRPQTGLQAKFSEQFAMAAAVILGKMGVEELQDHVVQRDDIQNFLRKVTITEVEEFDTRDPSHSPTERVVIRFRNGDVLDSGPISTIPGHAYDPLSEEELWSKFLSCTSATHSESEAKFLFTLFQQLPNLQSAVDIPSCSSVFYDVNRV